MKSKLAARSVNPQQLGMFDDDLASDLAAQLSQRPGVTDVKQGRLRQSDESPTNVIIFRRAFPGVLIKVRTVKGHEVISATARDPEAILTWLRRNRRHLGRAEVIDYDNWHP